MIEHLPPQYPKLFLDNATKMNYQKAIAFYAARMENFQNRLDQEMGILENDFIENLNKDIEKRWDKEISGRF